MLEIGTWVTQYRKGFWQIVDIKPKYAEENHVFEDGRHQEKGELIGSWILMKKGFTPKMRFQMDSDVCDSFWCKEVPTSVLYDIDNFFKDNPEKYRVFLETPYVDHPAVCTAWINLSDKEAELFRNILCDFPTRFTYDYAMSAFEKNGLKKCFSRPPTNYTFVCLHTLWELDSDYNPLYKNPEISAITTRT